VSRAMARLQAGARARVARIFMLFSVAVGYSLVVGAAKNLQPGARFRSDGRGRCPADADRRAARRRGPAADPVRGAAIRWRSAGWPPRRSWERRRAGPAGGR